MTRYVILEPAGQEGPTDRAVFVRDRFSWLAFLFPFIWLAVHRLWLAALLVLGAGIGLAFLGGAGGVLALLLGLLVALEGPHWLIRRYRKAGLREVAILHVPSLDEAEQIYFDGVTTGAEQAEDPVPAAALPLDAPAPLGGWRPARTLLQTADGR